MGEGWFERGMLGLGRQRVLLQENWQYRSVVALFFTAVFCTFAAPSRSQHLLAAPPLADGASSASAPSAPSALPSTIVIGFMGGMVKRDEPNRSEVQLAARLREQYQNAAYVDTYKNADWKDAYDKILKLLDVDKNGRLSFEEKQRARIIIFGQLGRIRYSDSRSRTGQHGNTGNAYSASGQRTKNGAKGRSHPIERRRSYQLLPARRFSPWPQADSS